MHRFTRKQQAAKITTTLALAANSAAYSKDMNKGWSDKNRGQRSTPLSDEVLFTTSRFPAERS